MEPNTDRMSMSIVVLLIAGALAGVLLTKGLPGIMNLPGAGDMNFLQWIFSLVGTEFGKMINSTGGAIEDGALGGLINMFRF